MNTGIRLRIYHWCPCSQLGGVEMALLAFIQGAPDADHLVFTANGHGQATTKWREAGAEVVEVVEWEGFLGLAWLRQWRLVSARYAIGRIVIWSPSRLPWVLAPLGTSTRVLVHFGNAARFGWGTRLFYGLARLLLRPRCRPTLVMCTSKVAKSMDEEGMLQGCRRVVIHNAVQSAYFDIRPAPRVGCEWGMVARLDVIKDHETLLRAVPLIVNKFPEFRLRIIGDGALRPRLEELIVDLGIGACVTLAGTEVRPWEQMRAWSGVVFSTGPREGFGIAAAEAMAMGLPCVFTDLPVMHEVGGDAVIYSAPGDPKSLAEKIGILISEPERSARLGYQASHRARQLFSPQSFAASYLKAFDQTP